MSTNDNCQTDALNSAIARPTQHMYVQTPPLATCIIFIDTNRRSDCSGFSSSPLVDSVGRACQGPPRSTTPLPLDGHDPIHILTKPLSTSCCLSFSRLENSSQYGIRKWMSLTNDSDPRLAHSAAANMATELPCMEPTPRLVICSSTVCRQRSSHPNLVLLKYSRGGSVKPAETSAIQT